MNKQNKQNDHDHETPLVPSSWSTRIPLNKTTSLTLFILEFNNFLFASVYLHDPVTGSLAIATPRLPNSPFLPTQELFQGQNSHLSSALAEMLANSTKKICLASINLPNVIGNEVQALHHAIQAYLQQRENALKEE